MSDDIRRWDEGRRSMKTAEQVMSENGLRKKRPLRKDWILYAFFVPALAWMLCFRLLPIPGVLIAFKDFNLFDGFTASPWVGLANFQRIFSQSRFFHVVLNTLEISLLKILFLFPIPILLSIMLNEFGPRRYKRLVQSVLSLPRFLSFVVIHGIFVNLLSTQGGPVNRLLGVFSAGPVNFYSNANFRLVLLLTEGFRDTGWNMIIYLSALTAVDQQLYEAAQLDGAGKLKQTIHVTLPSLMPVILLMLTLQVGGIMQAGTDQILVMYNPTVYQTADVIGTFVFREGVGKGQYSLATAVGLFESVVAFVLVLGTNTVCRKAFDRGLW
jgi:putative aldouronate transport system permease protein